MIPRKITVILPTGRRRRVRADLSVRVMLRMGLVQPSDEEALLDALDDVAMDDRELGRRLQDALVMHALHTTNASDLDGLAEPEFMEILGYAVRSLTGATDDAEAEDEDAVEAPDEVIAEPEPVLSLEDELALARAETLPEIKVPASAEVLEHAGSTDGP